MGNRSKLNIKCFENSALKINFEAINVMEKANLNRNLLLKVDLNKKKSRKL